MMMFNKNFLNRNYYNFYKRSFTTSTFNNQSLSSNRHLNQQQQIVNPIGQPQQQQQFQQIDIDHGFEKMIQFSADENVENNLKNILQTKIASYSSTKEFKQPELNQSAIDTLKQYLDLSYTNGDLVRVEIDDHKFDTRSNRYVQNVVTLLKSYNHVSYIVKGVKQS